MDGLLNLPDAWTLLRYACRTHSEVCTHISLEDSKTLCGRATGSMTWDDAMYLTQYGTTYDFYGGRPVQHRICRGCLKRALATITER